MCWGFKVFFRVFGNLAGRLLADALDASYKMCFVCSCTRTAGNVQQNENKVGRTAQEFQTGNDDPDDFYRFVDRERTEAMLLDRQNGTFLMRPSNFENSLGTMSIVQDARVFHLNVRARRDGFLALGNEKPNEKHFKDLNALINYHVSNYLILCSDGETFRTLLLPYRD